MLTVNALEELFVPGSKHTHEERKRLEHSRVEEGSNDPCRGPIDLDSGKVVLALPDDTVVPPRPRVESEDEGAGAASE